MSKATAQLNDYRQSPRKVRLVADLVRGKKIQDAIEILQFATKRASGPLVKLLQSALSNAKNNGIDENELFVEEITVDGGKILYRRRARARGSAFAIRKRTSHVKVILGTPTADSESSKGQAKKGEEKKEEKAPAKAVAPKTKAPAKKKTTVAKKTASKKTTTKKPAAKTTKK